MADSLLDFIHPLYYYYNDRYTISNNTMRDLNGCFACLQADRDQDHYRSFCDLEFIWLRLPSHLRWLFLRWYSVLLVGSRLPAWRAPLQRLQLPRAGVSRSIKAKHSVKPECVS